MDKWKDGELAKMKAGGNKSGKEFLRTQPDFKPEWDNNSITGASKIRTLLTEKYNSKALALLRDKVSHQADGKPWDEYSSSAQNWKVPTARQTNSGGVSSSGGGGGGAVSSNSFDERFKQNQSGSNFLNDQQLFDNASDVASKGFGMLSSGIGKAWGFGSSLASTATQKVQQGDYSSMASSGLGFLSNVAKTSIDTASNVVNTGLQNINSPTNSSASRSQKEPEQSEFWNKFGQKSESQNSGFGSSIWDNFGQGNQPVKQTKADGNFGGFGGAEEEKTSPGDGISDLYADNSSSGNFQGFGGSSKKKDDGWADDW